MYYTDIWIAYTFLMKVSQQDAVRQDWDKAKSWNYKLKHLQGYQSVVYAELKGDHGEVNTNEQERVYFIIEGEGQLSFNEQKIIARKGDVVTIPPTTTYDYRPINNTVLKVILFMELWDN